MHEERMQVRVSDILTRRGDTEHHRTIFSFSPADEVYTSTPKHVSWNKNVLNCFKRHFYFLYSCSAMCIEHSVYPKDLCGLILLMIKMNTVF